MNLKQIEKLYSISFIHNPKHFFGNSFEVQEIDGRKVLTGKARLSRNNNKNFKFVGILKPKEILRNPFK